MKKLILISVMLLISFFAYSNEWVNIGGRDYKICKIDTVQQIIICEGWYDIKEVDGEFFPEHKGGFGNYFYYRNMNKKNKVVLTDNKLQKIIKDVYPKKE